MYKLVGLLTISALLAWVEFILAHTLSVVPFIAVDVAISWIYVFSSIFIKVFLQELRKK